jgi:hypothetical protein
MRVTAIFLLGISTLGCKDQEAPRQAPAATAPAPQNPQSKVATPERPKLQEPEPAAHDEAWAKQMESSLPKVVPELTNVKCVGTQCTAQLPAANDDELTKLAAKLEDDDALQAIGAKHLTFSRDQAAVTIVVQF